MTRIGGYDAEVLPAHTIPGSETEVQLETLVLASLFTREVHILGASQTMVA